MTKSQLSAVKKVAKEFYKKTGVFHAWDHAEMVLFWAKKIASKYDSVNLEVLESAVYIHDIGRSIQDEGHPKISAEIAKDFLVEQKIASEEIALILEAVSHHDKAEINKAKSMEAKILFDADKLQIVSLFGFLRCLMWLVNERNMHYNDAIQFLFKYVIDVKENYLQTKEAKEVAKEEFPKIETMVTEFLDWQKMV